MMRSTVFHTVSMNYGYENIYISGLYTHIIERFKGQSVTRVTENEVFLREEKKEIWEQRSR